MEKNSIYKIVLIKCYNFQAATPGAPKPHIDDSKAHQVAIGKEFQLNCSASFALGVRGDLKWKVPNPNGIDVSLLIRVVVIFKSRL